MEDNQSVDDTPSQGTHAAAQATATAGHDSADDVCSTPVTADCDSPDIGSQQQDAPTDAVPEGGDQCSSLGASAETSTFHLTSMGSPSPSPAAAANTQEAVLTRQQDTAIAPSGSSDSTCWDEKPSGAVGCASHVAVGVSSTESSDSQPDPDNSNRLVSQPTAVAADGENSHLLGAAEQEQWLPAIAGNSDNDHQGYSSSAAQQQDSTAAVSCTTAGTGGEPSSSQSDQSAQSTESPTTDSTCSSNGSHLSIVAPAPLLRAGSNAIGQVKSPSRLRRMSFPAVQPDQQDPQNCPAQLDQQLQGIILACGRSDSGDLAGWQNEQQQQQQQQRQGQNEAAEAHSAPVTMQSDAHAGNLVSGQYWQQQHQQHQQLVEVSAEPVGSYAEPVHGSSSSSMHSGGPINLANHMIAPAAGTTAPSLKDYNNSSGSSSYSTALAATQQLPWPLSWHWPDTMVHAAATGVRPIDVRSSSSNGGGTGSSPSAAASSGGSSGGSRSGGKISRPNSPGSPSRSSTAAISSYSSSSSKSSGAESRASAGSRSTSPSRTAAVAGQQQCKLPEVLSAIHAYIASTPAVQQALDAATAGAMQQQDNINHSTAADVTCHYDHGNPTSVPTAVAAWHSSLQQQFAATFSTWDSDGDGFLNLEELQVALQDVLPIGAVGKEEARYCQVLLDRSGSGLISPHNLLAAAHTAVKMGVGVVPKTRVDINDILLQMVVQMKQEQQQHGAQQGFAVQTRSLFAELDTSGSGRLCESDLARWFRMTLPGINQQDVRYVLTHICDVTGDSSQVSLKQLIAAVQPVQQAVQQITNSLRHKEIHQQLQQQQQQPGQGLVLGSSDAGSNTCNGQQQQQEVGSQWDLPKPPSPVRLSPRPGHTDISSSSSSKNDHRPWGLERSSNGVNARSVDGSSSSSSDGAVAAVLVIDSDQPVPPVLWPMQELAALLSSHPTIIQLAFMQTAAAAAAAAARSPKYGSLQQRCSMSGSYSSSPTAMQQQQLSNQQQQRYSLIPISSLPQLLAAAAPNWGGADISYAALQIRCHMNVVANFAIDTPTAAAAAGSSAAHPAAAAADPPSDLMYAELAATIISAAGTEAAAAAGHLPAAVEQLVVDLTDELLSNDCVQSKLATAWHVAAAANVRSASSSSSSKDDHHNQGHGLPIVAAVKLLCKQLIGSHGLSDIRLLAWLTCLVRQQHLAMQLAAAPSGGSSSSNGGGSSRSGSLVGSAADEAADQGLLTQHMILSAEISPDQLSEGLLQVVQGLLPAEDAALIEDFKHQQQRQQQQHKDDSWEHAAAAALPGRLEGEQTTAEKTDRRARIQFDGSTPTPSECSPAWCPAEHHQQKWDEGLRSLDKRLSCNAGYFQPSHLGYHCDPSTPGSHTGSHYTSFLLDDSGTTRFSNHSGRWSSNGGMPLPPDAQQQREQLDRLRAAQQQAWKAEMLLQHMPWEGAYSPVAAAAAAAAEGGCFGSAKVVDILRISSSGLRTLSNMSEGY